MVLLPRCIMGLPCGEKCAGYVCETISRLLLLYYYIKTLDPHLIMLCKLYP